MRQPKRTAKSKHGEVQWTRCQDQLNQSWLVGGDDNSVVVSHINPGRPSKAPTKKAPLRPLRGGWAWKWPCCFESLNFTLRSLFVWLVWFLAKHGSVWLGISPTSKLGPCLPIKTAQAVKALASAALNIMPTSAQGKGRFVSTCLNHFDRPFSKHKVKSKQNFASQKQA